MRKILKSALCFIMGLVMLAGNGLPVSANSNHEDWFTAKTQNKDSIVSLVMHLTDEVQDSDGAEVVVTHYVDPEQKHTLIPGTSEADFFRYWPDGKVLYGWKTDPNSSTVDLTEYRGFVAPPSAGTYDYYAEWRDGWKLSFYSYSKGADSSPDGYYFSQLTVSNLYVLKDESLGMNPTTPTCSDSSRSFDYWEDQNGNTYQNSDIAGKVFTQDMKFWPVWSSGNPSTPSASPSKTVTLTMVLDANNKLTSIVNKGETAYAFGYAPGGQIHDWPAGKVLYGWSDQPDGKNLILKFPSLEITMNADTTLYAVWKDGYKMVFHPYSKGNENNPDGYYGNDPQYPGVAEYIDLKGQKVGTNEQPPAYSGSENLSFDYWIDQNGKTYGRSDIADQVFTEDMEFWPVWKKVSYFTVTYTSKDGIFENGKNTISYQIETGSPLTYSQIPGIGSPITYNGDYLANSWTGSDGVAYNPGMLMSKALDNDVTIEVGSVPAYPVTVDISGQSGVSFADGTSGTTWTNLLRANQPIYDTSLPQLNNSNTGYTLTGYKMDGTFYSIADLDSVILDGPKTLTPVWDKAVKVTFHTDEEPVFSHSINISTDQSIVFNAGSTSKFGEALISVGTKILKGWTRQQGGQTAEITVGNLPDQIFDSDTDLYAVWGTPDVVVTLDVNRKANSNAQSFRLNKNGTEIDSDQVQFGLASDAKFASYWFSPANKNDEVGYSTDPDSPIVDYTWQELAHGLHSAPSQNLTLYAKYGKAAKVTLDYDNADTENRDILVLEGNNLDMSQFKPEKTGYVLSGYTSGGVSYQPSDSIPVTGDCTIKTVWKQLKIAVKVTSQEIGGENIDSSYAGTLKNSNTPIIPGNQITMSDSAVQKVISNASGSISSGNKAVVQLYLDVALTGKTENSVTLDITPMFRLVEMPESEADETKIPEEGNGVFQIGDSQVNTEMANSRNAITITIPVPSSFNWADGTVVYIRHTHSGTTHTYQSKVSTGAVSFVNTEGFSTFTLSTADHSAAWVGNVGYDTLQEAVDHVSEGGTVRISSANKLSAVVRKKTSFKVNVSSENADFDISAGDGFTLNIDKSDAANPLYVFTEASKATSKPDKASGEAKTVQTNIAGKTSSTHVVPAKQVPNTADSFSPFGTMMKLMGSLIVAVGAGMILKKH